MSRRNPYAKTEQSRRFNRRRQQSEGKWFGASTPPKQNLRTENVTVRYYHDDTSPER